MNVIKVTTLSRGSFVRTQGWLLAGLLSMAGGIAAYAQTSTGNARPVRLNVVAVDSSARPIPDLTASDFTVVDDGSPQRIVSVRLNQSDRPRPLVILFDLLNAGEASRGVVANAMKTSLAHMAPDAPLYLYLLAEDGSLYPVHALPGSRAAQGATDVSWVQDIGPLLDAALKKVNEVKPLDFRPASLINLQARFNTTYHALDHVRLLMAAAPGPKELLWVTYGVPSTIHLRDRTWFDGVPFLRQLGAQFVRSDITVYTADPGLNLERGTLSRDTLDILTGATGGHAFSSVALGAAVSRIEAEAHTNYSVEYQPPANNWDGKYHKLRVTVARKGVHVQTELGYYAVSGS